MSMKRIAPTLVTLTGATKLYNLGQEFVTPATSTEGEKCFRYVQYDDGTANITANTHQLLVPLAGDNTVYTGDKTNLSGIACGRFAGILMGDVSTTSNKYCFIQTKGEGWLRAAGAAMAIGDAVYATPGGTDLQAEVYNGGLTGTTALYLGAASTFGVVASAAAETTSQLLLNLG